jgi:hypothetical protein
MSCSVKEETKKTTDREKRVPGKPAPAVVNTEAADATKPLLSSLASEVRLDPSAYMPIRSSLADVTKPILSSLTADATRPLLSSLTADVTKILADWSTPVTIEPIPGAAWNLSRDAGEFGFNLSPPATEQIFRATSTFDEMVPSELADSRPSFLERLGPAGWAALGFELFALAADLSEYFEALFGAPLPVGVEISLRALMHVLGFVVIYVDVREREAS